MSAGRKVLLADLQPDHADAVAAQMVDAGFDVCSTTVDVTSRESVNQLVERAAGLGRVFGIIHTAGVSPSNASPGLIFRVDLFGTAVVLETFGRVIAPGGSGVVVSSLAGHRLPALTPDETRALATTPADQLLDLPMLQPERVSDSLLAYQIAKRCSSLRVQAEAVRWARRGARINAISPGIVMTPLSRRELEGPHGGEYRRMIEACAAGRAGTPDEVGAVGALLMGPEGQFISGSDILMDGGVTSAFWYGDLRQE